ncbi:hypothetical protein BDR03DRAFT_950824 [Suillus americanus]|nr:hypothetical protein BDR03DRAFT_950824 [Suillus americanus]
MHFSFLAVIVALTASMAVSAGEPPGCTEQHSSCTKDKECCSGMRCISFHGRRTCDFPDK